MFHIWLITNIPDNIGLPQTASLPAKLTLCVGAVIAAVIVTVIAERKKNYVILGDVITVHKSQGSTLAYMQVYLSCFTGKKTAMGKNYQQPISQGQFYTFLSWAKIHDKVLFLNFEAEDTKVNESRGDVLNEEWVLATPLNRTEWY